MNVGDRFEGVDDHGQRYDCEVVWSGRGYLCAGYSGGSSLNEGVRQQPAKGVSGRGRPAPVATSQARLFA